VYGFVAAMSSTGFRKRAAEQAALERLAREVPTTLA
jgi:hypothetical protein